MRYSAYTYVVYNVSLEPSSPLILLLLDGLFISPLFHVQVSSYRLRVAQFLSQSFKFRHQKDNSITSNEGQFLYYFHLT